MHRNKNNALFAISGFLVTLLVILISPLKNEIQQVKSSNNTIDYTLSFTSTENKFNVNNNSQVVYTSLGNPIMFSYSGYSGALGKWGNLLKDGYVANDIALSGLINLSVIYGSATGDLVVSYGWWDDENSEIVYEVTDGLISSTLTEFDFHGYSPSFFKITASSAAQITSMTLTYDCEEDTNPFPLLNLLTFTKIGESYSITDCDESAISITIPSFYKGLQVTSIGNNAFFNCPSLTSVTIPDSVTSIGDYAFYYCTSLVSIAIPSSVTSIGDDVFFNCTSLTSATIPDSVKSIGGKAFANCTSLTSVTIPDSVISIGSGAFARCSKLISIQVDSANENFASFDGVLYDKDFEVLICFPAGLTSINFPTTITSIKSHAFSGCALLTFVNIPDSVTNIEDYAFSNCISLISITIPNSVISVTYWAFSFCTSLTSITIPSSITSIEDYAFYYCTSLVSIAIPSSVISVGDCAFSNCDLLSIKCQESSMPSGWSYNWNPSNCPVEWGAADRGTASSDGYTTAIIPWSTTAASLESWSGTGAILDVPSIVGGYLIESIASAFTDYSSVEYLRIPDSVTTISTNALSNMSSLNTIIIGSGVTSIEEGAFADSLPKNNHSTICFMGTPTQCANMVVAYFEENLYDIVLYSETERLPDTYYYWHYDSDGMTPLIWGVE